MFLAIHLVEPLRPIVDDRVRITFDRELSYKVTAAAEVTLNGKGWQNMMSNYVVLEIKFTGSYPLWIARMVKYFNLRQRSLSKYVRSMKGAYMLGLCRRNVTVL